MHYSYIYTIDRQRKRKRLIRIGLLAAALLLLWRCVSCGGSETASETLKEAAGVMPEFLSESPPSGERSLEEWRKKFSHRKRDKVLSKIEKAEQLAGETPDLETALSAHALRLRLAAIEGLSSEVTGQFLKLLGAMEDAQTSKPLVLGAYRSVLGFYGWALKDPTTAPAEAIGDGVQVYFANHDKAVLTPVLLRPFVEKPAEVAQMDKQVTRERAGELFEIYLQQAKFVGGLEPQSPYFDRSLLRATYLGLSDGQLARGRAARARMIAQQAFDLTTREGSERFEDFTQHPFNAPRRGSGSEEDFLRDCLGELSGALSRLLRQAPLYVKFLSETATGAPPAQTSPEWRLVWGQEVNLDRDRESEYVLLATPEISRKERNAPVVLLILNMRDERWNYVAYQGRFFLDPNHTNPVVCEDLDGDGLKELLVQMGPFGAEGSVAFDVLTLGRGRWEVALDTGYLPGGEMVLGAATDRGSRTLTLIRRQKFGGVEQGDKEVGVSYEFAMEKNRLALSEVKAEGISSSE
ncbi:MAG: hypothetical protein V2A74_10235 [bacterium]